MSQAVSDVFVNITKVVEGTKARHAFVIAKGLKGVFRMGDNPLSTDSPYLEEQDAIELMGEIMTGIEQITSKYNNIFLYFKNEYSLRHRRYLEMLEFAREYLVRPHSKDFLRKADHIRFNLPMFQHDSWYISVPRDYLFGTVSLGDFTWGFESVSELFASMLALTRLVIEVLRQVLPDREEFVEKALGDVDKSIDMFDDFLSNVWNRRVGQLQRFPRTGLKATPTAATSHNGELYFVTSPDGKLLKFVEDTCSEADTNVTLTQIVQLVSHKGKLYCITESGNLYELDPASGRSTLLIEDTPFKLCTSMVSLGDYLYITLNTYLYNLYRIDPIEKSYTCAGYWWCGAKLATVEHSSVLYSRYRHFLWDTIFKTNHPENDKLFRSYFATDDWKITNEPNLVGLGEYLYTQGSDGDVFAVAPILSLKDDNQTARLTRRSLGIYDSAEGSFKKYGDSDRLVPLAGHKMSVVCLHVSDSKFSDSHPHLSVIRPVWIPLPGDWFKKMMANGGLP